MPDPCCLCILLCMREQDWIFRGEQDYLLFLFVSQISNDSIITGARDYLLFLFGFQQIQDSIFLGGRYYSFVQ